jgi:hypothetical protein
MSLRSWHVLCPRSGAAEPLSRCHELGATMANLRQPNLWLHPACMHFQPLHASVTICKTAQTKQRKQTHNTPHTRHHIQLRPGALDTRGITPGCRRCCRCCCCCSTCCLAGTQAAARCTRCCRCCLRTLLRLLLLVPGAAICWLLLLLLLCGRAIPMHPEAARGDVCRLLRCCCCSCACLSSRSLPAGDLPMPWLTA